MLFRRLGAVAFGAGAALIVVACSQAYAEDTKPVEALPEAGAADSNVTSSDADIDRDSVAPDASATYVELAKGLNDLAGIAATETDVYVVERALGNVRALPIGGGTPTYIESGGGTPRAIAATGEAVYWGDFGGAWLKSLSAGATRTVTTGTKSPFAVSATKAGVAVLAIGSGDVGELQPYDANLIPGFKFGSVSNPFDVAAYHDAFYWTEAGAGRINQSQFGSSTSTELATGETDCQSIAANATAVFWTRPSQGLVRMKKLSSLTPGSLVTGEVGLHSIAVDDSDVYWLTSDGKLRRKRTGPQELPPATLASGFGSAFAEMRTRAIALTSKYVVWITTDGRVLRTDK